MKTKNPTRQSESSFQHLVKAFLLFTLVLALSSCGFKLKGASSASVGDSKNADAEVTSEFSDLQISSITESNVAPKLRELFGILKTNPNATLRINLLDEKLETKVISYDNSAEPNGYEISINLSYEIVRMKDNVRERLFFERVQDLDYLFISDGDSQSEANREQMKQIVSNLSYQLANRIYSNALGQLKKK